MVTRVKGGQMYSNKQIYSESTARKRWWKSWGFVV